jgi:hypothetical protein
MDCDSHTEVRPPSPRRRAATGFFVQLAVAAAAVGGVLAARAFLFRSHYLGEIWLSPLFTYWNPAATWRLLPAAAAVAAAAGLIFYGLRAQRLWPLPVAAFVNVAAVGLGPAFGRPYPFAALERYLVNARLLFEAPNVFENYVAITKGVGALCRTRPGLTFWFLGALDHLAGGNIYFVLFFYVALAALSVAVLYAGARVVVSREAALLAAALFACSPALLFFGAGPVGLNCLLGTALIALGLKAASAERPWGWAAAFGLTLAVALTTYFALAVFVLFLLALVIAAALAGRSWLRSLAIWVGALAVAAAALALFQLLTGYDHLAVFERAYWANQELPTSGTNVLLLPLRAVSGSTVETPELIGRPYWFFVFGNLLAAFVAVGLPVGVLYLREIFRIGRAPAVRRSFYGASAAAFLVTFLAFNFSGLVLGEVERVWLFLYPAFYLVAGVHLAEMEGRAGRCFLYAIFILLITQAFVYKIFLV